MFVYLVTFCIVSVLFRFCVFFDNFFALLHVLTNQSRYEYVSLYWVHSASKPKWTKFDWRRLIQGHTLILIRSHTTLAQIFKLIFPPTIIPQFYFALVSPLFSPLGILLSKLLWQVNHWWSLLSEFNFLCDCIIWLNLWF